MKLRLLVLFSSAVLNAALLGAFIARPSLAPSSLRGVFGGESAPANAPRPPSGPKGASAAPAAKPELWSALHSPDIATLVARLREAGFPAFIIRAIADVEIERVFRPRLQALSRAFHETPYWKSEPGYYSGNPRLFEQLNQIYRERSRVLRDLLGQDAFAMGGMDPTALQRMQFGNLSPAKIDLVQRINDDYNDMMGQVRAAMQGVTLPEDREKLALLEREKRADLAAVLTTEELADYEMRTSPITSRLRSTFNIMEVSEAEFRAVYKVHEPFKDILYPTAVTYFSSEMMDQRREAQQAVNQQIKAALGEARWPEYQRASDSDFQQLYRLGQRDNVAYDTLVRVHNLRTTTSEAALRILDDRAMPSEQKRAALTDLANGARSQILAALGPTTGPAYADNSRWLVGLQHGRVTSVASDGISTMTRTLPLPPPPKK